MENRMDIKNFLKNELNRIENAGLNDLYRNAITVISRCLEEESDSQSPGMMERVEMIRKKKVTWKDRADFYAKILGKMTSDEILRQIQAWKKDSERLQKMDIDEECCGRIKQDYLERYSLAREKYRQIEEARRFRNYLSCIMSALQNLLGYEKAVREGKSLNEQQRTVFFEEAVHRIRQAQYPDEEIPCVQPETAADEVSKQVSLEKVLDMVKDMESRITPASANVLAARRITMELRETLEEIRACSNLETAESQELKTWAENIRNSMEQNGWYPRYCDSEGLAGRDNLRENAFNQGNAVAIEIPGIFMKVNGEYRLLEGFIGLKTE